MHRREFTVGKFRCVDPTRQDHPDAIIPGMLPNAADAVPPGDREDMRRERESRARRLAAWEAELDEQERDLGGDRRALAGLRETADA